MKELIKTLVAVTITYFLTCLFIAWMASLALSGLVPFTRLLWGVIGITTFATLLANAVRGNEGDKR